MREQCVSLCIQKANTGHGEPTLLTVGEKWPGGDAAFSYWGLSGRAELGAAGLPLLGPSLCTAAVASGSEQCRLPGPGSPTTRTCSPHPWPGQMAPWLLCGPWVIWTVMPGVGNGRAPLIGLQPVPCGRQTALPASAAGQGLPSRGSTGELLCP